ncbi:MAG: acyltransferase family protein [Candidatus Bathyarchaeota archaeon]|nr:MAG: acyltransferase family protein [Candidatus Bathyarchaeota archaeon]
MNGQPSRSSNTGTPGGTRAERWYWLDWLRVLAMGVIFLYHCGRPFVLFGWHIMDTQPDMLFTLVNIFATGWIMPLFFTISGMATYFSLTRRSPRQFVEARFKRLMTPFIFALLVILPVHVYYEIVFNGYFSGSFFDFFPLLYFTRGFPFEVYLSPTYFAGANQGIYLWYLFWLLIFSLITAHFFKWLRREENRDRISKLAAVCNRRGGIFLLAIPLLVVDVSAVRPFFVFPSGYGGWKLPTYLVFFILAYVLASDPQFQESIDKNRTPAFLLGIITSTLIILFFGAFGSEILADPIFYVLFTTLWAFNGWCWVITILGFGRRLLSFNNKLLRLTNELVLPFYILHQTAIIVAAFYIVPLNLAVIVRYLIIVLASFTLIAILLVPIRKINASRFLFGMRRK